MYLFGFLLDFCALPRDLFQEVVAVMQNSHSHHQSMMEVAVLNQSLHRIVGRTRKE